MKKIFAISLLFVHLFNIGGYQFLFSYLMDQSDIKASRQFDQRLYDDKDLAEVKIPLNLPYITGSGTFERIDGTLEFNGIHYNYVKRKISKDTLYILFQPNYAKTRLVSEKNGYISDISDTPLSKNFPAPSLKKNSYPAEYNQPGNEYYTGNKFTVVSITAQLKSSKLPTGFYHVTGEPPESVC